MTAALRPVLTDPQSEPTTPRLALRPREAAKAIGISPRLLWTPTKRGEVPHIRLNKAVVYPVEALRRWMDERATGGCRNV